MLKIGTTSDVDVKEKTVINVLNSTRESLEKGIVLGGDCLLW